MKNTINYPTTTHTVLALTARRAVSVCKIQSIRCEKWVEDSSI